METHKKLSVKSVLAIALCLIMLMVTACSKQEAQGGNEQDDTGNYKDKLKISVASTIQLKDGQLDNEFHKHWMDKFNLEWDYNFIEWDSWAEKLRLWINSGDLPDVASWNYIHGDAMNYIDQGLLYKFPDDWKERWPNVAAAYKLTGLGDKLEELSGGTYILPRPVYYENKPADPLVNQIGVIALRKDWANAVGFELKDVYTTSELMTFANLVKEKDPGKAGGNLVPISYNAADALTNIIMPNSEHSRVESAFYKGEDGQYHWGPADEETLAGLKLMQKAYKDGLLNPEFYTWKNNEGNDNFRVKGVAAVTSLGGLASYRQDMDKAMEKNLGADSDELVHTAIVLGDDGKYRNLEQVNFWSALIFSPNISTEKFERIMDLLDYSTSKDGQMLLNMGFEGKDWKYGDNKELVSLLPEGTSLDDKYPSRFEGLYLLGDDFSMINPAIKKEYRDRAVLHYQNKAKLGKEGGKLAEYDWAVQLYDSKVKNQATFDYETEYTNLILQSGDLEANWKKWVDSKKSLVEPVLEELNNQK
ncbi:type 2 periplasmic-binding domain-containing protein [Paenibacillus apiarius]|uniref:Extracellular solute-binding protein n=1 Tax=Paenibacillus apiarius TaxID=46240 RepID=A0ABT4DZD7_9BACL|nr:extracellular solute-binding protein [Paenibacillus apiarius]MCY9515172.1 extracellular solute-binding protein [Paenibacillus apiarius]MCY9522727.1 extracellular solute-binding protein [Paenibacillus apiarius]MCY9552947.1 extracellular solute-binding protein [Paenibacillus apiarius]MCY9557636.1 extracellular solute-binding protein [Paenibacillus apiarius]MCY9681875.1 extracellular solute-binding protein [Paenibacillus apiarius]